MKDDKTKPMTPRQTRQLEKLGIVYDKQLTVHEANQLANKVLQPSSWKNGRRANNHP